MKKAICLIAVFLMLGSLLHASGQKPETAAAAMEKITLRFQDHANETRNVFIRKALEAYEKAHPNVTIKFEEYPWGNIREKVLTQAAGKDLPDITYTTAQN